MTFKLIILALTRLSCILCFHFCLHISKKSLHAFPIFLAKYKEMRDSRLVLTAQYTDSSVSRCEWFIVGGYFLILSLRLLEISSLLVYCSSLSLHVNFKHKERWEVSFWIHSNGLSRIPPNQSLGIKLDEIAKSCNCNETTPKGFWCSSKGCN